MPLLRLAATIAAASLLSTSLAAQRLTLGDALARADQRAYANRIARGSADAQAAEALKAYRGILPALRVEAGVVRTTDPIGVFGTTLRQRAITPADFDPARLNFPAAVNNRVAALVLEQPLLNADAWVGRQAGASAAAASRAAADWTRTDTRTDVIRAYFGATLARERLETLESAERAAQAHVARAKALADTGLVTRSDALLAEVRAGEISGSRLAAAGDASHAARALALLLGDPQASFDLPATLPVSNSIRALVVGDTTARVLDRRADVQAAELALDASRADAWRAKAAYLPRLNGFARYDWNDPTGLFQNEKSWTVGVMATWSPFAGASAISDVRATNARADRAAAQHDAAVAQAELERARTLAELQLALAQLDIAESAVAQSVEAHRIVARKYDGGLATISDLLEASAMETRSRLGASAARYQLIISAAERRQALGDDPAFLHALTTP